MFLPPDGIRQNGSAYAGPTSLVPQSAWPNPIQTAGNLLAWYWADYAVHLTSSVVDTWGDLSGNGRDATQGTAGARPSTGVGVNGHTYILSASGKQLKAATFPNTAQPLDVFVVADPASGSVATAGYILDFNGGNIQVLGQFTGTPNQWSMYSGATLSILPAVTGPVLIEGIYNGGTSSIALNGGTPVTGTIGSNVPAGAGLAIGDYYAGPLGTTPFVGKIYEIAIFGANLTSAKRTSITSYLKRKYGL